MATIVALLMRVECGKGIQPSRKNAERGTMKPKLKTTKDPENRLELG
jgi:hypothetical protein